MMVAISKFPSIARFSFGGTICCLTRRAFLKGGSVAGAALGLAGCSTTNVPWQQTRTVDPIYRRTAVRYDTREAPGTIVVDPGSHFLYAVQGTGQALRYGIGVGGEGYGWSGIATVHSKQEWPDWYPPKEMLARRPELMPAMKPLQAGLGMPGGPNNPLGARAMYLWQDNKDTLYRIHGTNEPWTIGQNVSAGCIRMTNEEVIDLYDRTAVRTKVVVLAAVS
jgi:lipoprotein-anchoring transpeptidase ErfK/SrfK